jgi:hypothetical protein
MSHFYVCYECGKFEIGKFDSETYNEKHNGHPPVFVGSEVHFYWKDVCKVCTEGARVKSATSVATTTLLDVEMMAEGEGSAAPAASSAKVTDDDELLLSRCVITPSRVQELSSFRILEFGSLLDDSTSVDVTFVVNNERIPAHRIILAARSTYLRTMFSSTRTTWFSTTP